MPAGLHQPITGYLVFTCIKFAGYTLAASYINNKYPEAKNNIFKVGSIRTLIGMIIGALYGLGVVEMGVKPELILVVLIPIRFFEWWIILKYFYLRKRQYSFFTDGILNCSLIVWSFVLDIPAIIGFINIGGVRLC